LTSYFEIALLSTLDYLYKRYSPGGTGNPP
jgi:hypothetical protein